jgi:proteasome activator subunit 4
LFILRTQPDYLQDRFVKLLSRSPLPNRQSPVYNAAIRQRHAAILGICALVDSYPYTVERWMPDLLANILAEHAYDPVCLFTPPLASYYLLALLT